MKLACDEVHVLSRIAIVALETLPSVKVVFAVRPLAPVAVTVYVAMKKLGSWNWYVKLPLRSAATSASSCHVWPASSLTVR